MSKQKVEPLVDNIATTAFAFRGYNVTNLGKSPQFLANDKYRPIVEAALRRTAELCSQATGREIDLVSRIRNRIDSTLDSFAEDVALSVGMETAHIEILERIFHVEVKRARMSFGYSIGELSALVLGGAFELEDLLPVPLRLADDCALLARDVSMGVVFTRGPTLDWEKVRRLCLSISCDAEGMIAPSSYLSPNTVLVLGEGTTVERLRKRAKEELAADAHVRINPHRWPPLHTPLVWRKCVPNRAGVHLHEIKMKRDKPSPAVVSFASGRADYGELSARVNLVRWVDHPQLVWDVVDRVLDAGVETIVHVGPEPNLLPATFERLASNVSTQLGVMWKGSLGRSFVREMSRSWLVNALSSRASLLRAPFVKHIILEDWLLAHAP